MRGRGSGGVHLVTGAAGGIGRALVGRLLAAGHRVVAADRTQAGLDEAACEARWPELGLAMTAFDVRDAGAWEGALDLAEARFGPVDVLHHVAGVLRPGYVDALSADDVALQLDVNAAAVALGTTAAARRMVARGRGHIVTIGSLASLAPVPGLSLYSMSKFAVRGFTLAAAQELAPKGVAVTLVMPDAVETPMLTLQEAYEEAAFTFSGRRVLTPADVADAVMERVLRDRPMELALPTSRGALARLANVAPRLTRVLGPALRSKGLEAQRRRRARR